MPQILKEETRRAILRSALELFARNGYRDTTLQEVARVAGLSTGNLYRYFPDKKALYDAALPRELLDDLTAALDRKFAAWRGIPLSGDSDRNPVEVRFREELTALLAAHRLQWVVLLREGLEETLADRLTRFFTRWAGEGEERPFLDEERTAAIRLLYRHLACLIGAVLAEGGDPGVLGERLRTCLDYHMAGLAALTETWRNT